MAQLCNFALNVNTPNDLERGVDDGL